MNYFFIIGLLNFIGFLFLIESNGSSILGAGLIALPWLFLPVVTWIEKKFIK